MVDAGFDVKVVLTRPDRPQGRGLKVDAECGQVAGARARTAGDGPGKPENRIRSVRSRKRCDRRAGRRGLRIDSSAEVLTWPRFGCVNIHASLLPRWRGAAPIQRALLAGDLETGVSIMQMDAGLDTGPVIATDTVPIASRETAGTLLDKLAAAGAQAIVRALHTPADAASA